MRNEHKGVRGDRAGMRQDGPESRDHGEPGLGGGHPKPSWEPTAFRAPPECPSLPARCLPPLQTPIPPRAPGHTHSRTALTLTVTHHTHIQHSHTPHTLAHVHLLTAPVAKSLPKWFSSCLWLCPWVPTMVSEMESIVPDKRSVPVATLTL